MGLMAAVAFCFRATLLDLPELASDVARLIRMRARESLASMLQHYLLHGIAGSLQGP